MTMATSAAAVLALAVLASLASCSLASVFGGATSVGTLEPALIARYSGRRSIGTYAAVGSGAGISGFAHRTIAIAASDDPMTVAQDRASPAKFTFPQVLTSYSFIVSRSTRVALTAQQVWYIYSGRITSWSQIKNSGLTGTIIPVARSDGSGTTELVTNWLLRNRAGIPVKQVGLGPWAPGSKHLVRVKGSGGVAAYVKAHAGAIGYVQTGIGVTQYHNYEVALRNPAGTYLKAIGTDITQSVPRALPSPAATWSGVTLLNAAGKKTYPIASFVYIFTRRSYGASDTLVKNFLNYLLSTTVQNLGPKYFFTPLPSKVRNVGLSAVKAIKG